MMSLAAIVLIASVIIFALIGVPLVWSLVLASVCSVAAGGTLNALPILAQRMFAGGLQYSMLAIFFFVLAGAIMQYGGLSRRLVAHRWSVLWRVHFLRRFPAQQWQRLLQLVELCIRN